MMENMPSSLYAKWLAFDRIEPVSLGWRGDHQAGVISATLANIYRGKSQAAYKAADFMPKYGERKLPSPKDLYGKFRAWAMMNGAVKQ